jgi:hypothetical protein
VSIFIKTLRVSGIVGGTTVIELYNATENKIYEGPSPTAFSLALGLKNASVMDSFYERSASQGMARSAVPHNRHWETTIHPLSSGRNSYLYLL